MKLQLLKQYASYSYNNCKRTSIKLQLKASVKESNSSICFFFHPSLNGVLFPMFCLLVEGECQNLVF